MLGTGAQKIMNCAQQELTTTTKKEKKQSKHILPRMYIRNVSPCILLLRRKWHPVSNDDGDDDDVEEDDNDTWCSGNIPSHTWNVKLFWRSTQTLALLARLTTPGAFLAQTSLSKFRTLRPYLFCSAGFLVPMIFWAISLSLNITVTSSSMFNKASFKKQARLRCN